MRYIEIADGVSVKIDSIEAVLRTDSLSSEVVTADNSYTSIFPYEVLLELLEMEEKDKDSDLDDRNIFKQIDTSTVSQ